MSTRRVLSAQIWSPATTLAQLQQAARALNNVRDTHNLRAFTVPNGSTPSIRKTQRELADFITKFVHSTKRATVARAIFSLSRAACVGDAGGDALDKQVLPLFTFNVSAAACRQHLPAAPLWGPPGVCDSSVLRCCCWFRWLLR